MLCQIALKNQGTLTSKNIAQNLFARQILWMMGISFVKINNIHGHKIKIKQLQGRSMSEDFGF